jgi:uncharacterized membrane protein (DUF485 family)
MKSPVPDPTDVHGEAFLGRLLRGQLRLSMACAGAFLVVLLALPLANYFFPDLMARRVFGFTLTWFILGVLFFPFVWLIAWVFIRRSIALEEAEVREVKLQAPSSKLQTSSKHPGSKGGAALGLVLGAWCFSGAWCLGLGA